MSGTSVAIIFAIVYLFQNTQQSTPEDNYYIAAVVEYNSPNEPNITELAHGLNNADRYMDIIGKAAAYKVDIIVFPEVGLLSYDHTLYVEVPDPANKIIPAKNNSCHEILRKISQAAADNKMYVVINIHEVFEKNPKEVFKYNTNVVFDRTGAIIARYRKYNLYGERNSNREASPDHVHFETDFGVNFGTFICFDIIFEEPAVGLVNNYNVTDIVFPTAWFPELPFQIGIQVQSTWAYATDVNLLAAGYNNVTAGNTGSGIYAGKKGPVVYLESEGNGTKILIGKVPKRSQQVVGDVKLEPGQIIFYDKNETKHPPIIKEDFKEFVTQGIKPETLKANKSQQIDVSTDGQIKGLKKDYLLQEQLCHGHFCCNFSLSFTVKYYQNTYKVQDDATFNQSDAYYHFRYRLMAYDGIRSYVVGNTSGQQICAIIPCLNDDLDSCAKRNQGMEQLVVIDDKVLGKLIHYSTDFNTINISGNFHNKRVLLMPNILLTSTNESTFGRLLDPNKYQFTVSNSTDQCFINLIVSPEKFATGGIIARIFERDNLKPNSSNAVVPNWLFLLISTFIYLISME